VTILEITRSIGATVRLIIILSTTSKRIINASFATDKDVLICLPGLICAVWSFSAALSFSGKFISAPIQQKALYT
jgi:hypothetical protein